MHPLVALGHHLRSLGYAFTTPTPETHRRVNARPENARATTLEGVLGWSRPFERGSIDPRVEAWLEEAGVIVAGKSAVRYSTLDGSVFVHSAYPTSGADAVFFGPDTYRFVRFLERELGSAKRVVDVGAGSGAGGLAMARHSARVVLADINPAALSLARVNAALAGIEERVEIVESDVLSGVSGDFDAVIANPPYLADEEARLYRDGGGPLGLDLSIRIASEAMARLSPGGRLLLYTGSPVVGGKHPLVAALGEVLDRRAASWRWEEIDPDVFGEELDRPAYRAADRIAVVGVVARCPG